MRDFLPGVDAAEEPLIHRPEKPFVARPLNLQTEIRTFGTPKTRHGNQDHRELPESAVPFIQW